MALVFLSICMLAGLVGFAGCGSTEETTTPSTTPVVEKIKFGYFGIDDYKDLYIAKEKGFFTENNLDVELVCFEAVNIIAAMVGGSIDGGVESPATALPAIQAGADIKLVASSVYYDNMESIPWICVLEDSPVQTAADLNGKTIAGHTEGSLYWLWVKAAELENNIEFGQYIGAPAGQFQPMLINGQVDCAIMNSRDIYIKWPDQVRPIVPLSSGPKMEDGYYFSAKFLDEHPSTVENFVKALTEARAWYSDNTTEGLEIVSHYGYRSLEDLQKMTAMGIISKQTPEVRCEVWQLEYGYNLMQELGIITEDIYIPNYIDARFTTAVWSKPDDIYSWLP